MKSLNTFVMNGIIILISLNHMIVSSDYRRIHGWCSEPNIPEFLKIAEALKVEQASTETAKVLAGSADAGREVFEAQTKG